MFDDPFLGGATVRWSYQDLEVHARRVARGLLAADVGKGTRVGILMGNRPEAVAALFGVWLVGAIAVPISTFSPMPELAHLIRHADISILLLQTSMGNRRFATDVRALCPAVSTSERTFDPEFPYLRRAFSLGPEPELNGLESWGAFLAGGETIGDELLDAVAAQVHPSDLGVIIYSSGTTEQPKGIILNQRAVSLQCQVQASLFARDRSTRVFCALPMFWTAGLHTAMGATFAGGATWVMQEKFEAGHALHLLQRERVTEPHVLSHQASALEEHADWSSTDLTSCTRIFGKSVFASTPERARRRVVEHAGRVRDVGDGVVRDRLPVDDAARGAPGRWPRTSPPGKRGSGAVPQQWRNGGAGHRRRAPRPWSDTHGALRQTNP